MTSPLPPGPMTVPARSVGKEIIETVSGLSSVPELFPGFRGQMFEQHGKVSQATIQLQELAGKQQDLMSQFEQAEAAPLQKRPLIQQSFISMGENQQVRAMMEAAFDTEEFRAKQSIFALEFNSKIQVLERESWRLELMSSLSTLMEAGEVNSLEEILRKFPFEGMNHNDRGFAGRLYNGLRKGIPAVGFVSPDAPQVLSVDPPATDEEVRKNIAITLSKPRGSLDKFLSISSDQQSIEQVLDSLTDAGRFMLPEGLSNEDIKESFKEAGLADADINSIMLDVKAQSKEISDRIEERNAYFQQLKIDAAKMFNGDIVSAIDRAKMARAFSQPGIGLMAPADWWINKVSMPIAGIDIAIMERVIGTFDGREQTFNEDVARYRRGGANWWTSYGHAWENLDMNGVAKFTVEILADPLTYFGFGLYAKPFGIFPKVTRIQAGVMRAEKIYLEASELPWRGLRAIWQNVVPKTLNQHAFAAGNATSALLRKVLSDETGKPIRNVTVSEAQDIIETAVEMAIQNPMDPSRQAKLGKQLLGRRVIDEDQLRNLVGELGVTAPEMTTARLESINTVLEMTDGQGIAKFLQPQEAAQLLLRRLDLADSPENIQGVVKWLGAVREGAKAQAVSLANKGDIREVLTGVQSFIRQNHVDAERLAISNRRVEGGLVASALNHLDDNLLSKLVFALDRNVTLPFARAYLLFGLYAPFNVLENMGKTIAAGGSAFWRGGVHPSRRASVLFKGMEDEVPLEVLFEDRFVPQLDFGVSGPSTLLSGSVKLTARQRKEATKDMRNALERFLAPRWLKSISGFNWGADVGGTQRQQYWISLYRKGLVEEDAETVGQFIKLVDDETVGLEKLIGSKEAESYKQSLVDRLLTGDLDNVKNITSEFTPRVVAAGEVDKAFDAFPDVGPHIRDFVKVKAQTGELWSAGPAGVNRIFDRQVREIVLQQYMDSLKFFNTRYKETVQAMVDWVPVTQSELNYKMNFIDQSVNMWGEALSSTISSGQRYAERLQNPIEKAAFYDSFWNVRIKPYMSEGADSLRTIMADIKKQLPKVSDLDPMQKEAYERLIDQHTIKMALVQKTRQDAEAVRRSWQDTSGVFYKPTKERKAEWWDGFRAAQAKPWDDLKQAFIDQAGHISDLKASITGLETPVIIDATKANLNVSHISDLFGVAPSELRRNMYLPEMMALRGKNSFIGLVRNRAKTAAGGFEKADDLGYTEKAIGDVYDSIMFSLKNDPGGVADDLAPLFSQLSAIRSDIISIGQRRGAMFSNEAAQQVQGMVDNIGIELTRGGRGAGEREKVRAFRKVFAKGLSPWQKTRTKVLKNVRRKFQFDFPDYDNQTAVSTTMRTLYPFWGYEAHRYAFWIPREFTRHPGSYAAWGKYENNTDQGYIHIPGTDLDVNPLRGTIFMGGMRRLFQRDYPEYYDAFGGMSEVVDSFSRWGFYPGAPYGIVSSMFGAKFGRPQFGEVAPSSFRTVINGASALFPQETQPLRDIIFPDRFRDFQIANKVSAMGQRNGMQMLEKKIAGTPLTDTEQQIWNSGAGGIGALGMLMEQTSLFRFRPEEKLQVFSAANRIISEETGIPVSSLVDLRKFGLRVEDVFGPLHPSVHQRLNALEGWSRFTGGSVALQPSEYGKIQALTREFWDSIANKKQEQKNELLVMENSMKAGTNNIKDWLFLVKRHNQDLIDFIESQATLNPRYADPDNKGESLIPMTLDERQAFAEKHDMLLIQFHPLEELRDLYFQNKLETKYDPEINAYVLDWDSFFLYREMMEQGAGAQHVEELRSLNEADDTNLQIMQSKVNRDYFRPYNAAFDALLETKSESEREVILNHRRADTPEERASFEAIETQELQPVKVVSTFNSELRQIHKNMRDIDPELDAWLAFFQITRTTQSDAAALRLEQIRSGFGLP